MFGNAGFVKYSIGHEKMAHSVRKFESTKVKLCITIFFLNHLFGLLLRCENKEIYLFCIYFNFAKTLQEEYVQYHFFLCRKWTSAKYSFGSNKTCNSYLLSFFPLFPYCMYIFLNVLKVVIQQFFSDALYIIFCPRQSLTLTSPSYE